MIKIYLLKSETRLEVYQFIDTYFRKLPRNSAGDFDELADGFADNDVDALRHAYASGVYTMEYGETTADILGGLNELTNFDSSPTGPSSQNMDLWNKIASCQPMPAETQRVVAFLKSFSVTTFSSLA